VTTQVTIDSAGRVLIPKPLRYLLALAPGDTLDIESTGQSITLRPSRTIVPLTKEKGVWVFRTGHPLDPSVAESQLAQIRTIRDRQNVSPKI
jgi:AbrB family looped-hinge helix DNA binding protein